MPTSEKLAASRAHLRHLANVAFPEAASAGGYPVHLNHCFLRIVYDTVFEAKWNTVLPKGRGAAVDRLSPKQLEQAVKIGEAIIADPALCAELNSQSLAYRGKG